MKIHGRTTGSIVAAIGVSAAVLMSNCQMSDTMDMAHSEYMISMPSPRHFHAFKQDTLFFLIHSGDMMTPTPVPGLTPTVTWQLKGDTNVVQSVPGDVIDKNDGTYFFPTRFYSAGFYTLTLGFEFDGTACSQAFAPFEVSKAGGERIFCPDSASAEYNYQIRWGIKPGAAHGGDTATFDVEIKRSFSTPVNTTEPYNNTFDHLTPSDLVPAGALPTIKVGSAAGEDSLTVVYKGLGIYRALSILPSVASSTTFWLHVSFDDVCGQIDENGETNVDYQFPVLP